MKKSYLHIFLFFLSFLVLSLQSNPDSLFIVQVKKYVSKEFGFGFRGDFYTTWKKENTPYLCLFVSKADSVKRPSGFGNQKYDYPFIDCKSELESETKLNQWKDKGYHAYIYRTCGTSNCELTHQLLNYPNEAKCFIIFHELLHNYIFQREIKIPYYLHEALGDVVANYASLNYCEQNTQMDLSLTRKQIQLNEKIYKCLNKYIAKINKGNCDVLALNSKCNKEIQKLLIDANSFQKDRFNYEVNNAYLLKNSNYCVNYFLLKRVLKKQKSILKLLEIMRTMPQKKENCCYYLEQFT